MLHSVNYSARCHTQPNDCLPNLSYQRTPRLRETDGNCSCITLPLICRNDEDATKRASMEGRVFMSFPPHDDHQARVHILRR